jgi:hypothetical protein
MLMGFSIIITQPFLDTVPPYMDTPKSSMLMGFSIIINQPFLDTVPPFMETPK